MKVCYYSDVTKKYYESEDALIAAETEVIKAQKAAEEKNKARKTRAQEVEDAYKSAVEAQKKYLELRNKFVKDYGSYHTTFNEIIDQIFGW
jgi:seryl-tRNA synthetase